MNLWTGIESKRERAQQQQQNNNNNKKTAIYMIHNLLEYQIYAYAYIYIQFTITNISDTNRNDARAHTIDTNRVLQN